MRTFGACWGGGVRTHPVHPPGYGPLCDISYARYSEKSVTQIYKALYGDAMLVSLSGAQVWPPETNRNIYFLVFEFSYLCVNSSLEELIKIKVIFIPRQGMFRQQNLPKSVMLLTHIRAFLAVC